MPFSVLRPRFRALLFTLICAISLVFALGATNRWLVTTSAAGATITVNSTADAANNADGVCTLREAIPAANTNTASGVAAGECAAGTTEPDTIVLTGLAGSITLTTELPFITSHASIVGPGKSTLTIQRGPSTLFAIFTINSSGNATISGLSLVGGDGTNNAGLNNNGGTTTISNCSISGFGAGMLQGQGTLTVSNCEITGNLNGGGIANSSGTLNVINSVISGNAGGHAAGIDNTFGVINITNTTISGNTGGLGGIVNGFATATIIDSTISNNSQRGILNNGNLTMIRGSITGNGNGGAFLAGTSVVNGVTVSGNSNTGGTGLGGGGIFVSGIADSTITIMNCLVTNNSTTGAGGGIRNGGGRARIFNTTITGNSANSGGGGISIVDGGLGNFIGVNLTVTGNRANFGGGVLIESGPTKFKNSIIAGNLNAGGTFAVDINGPTLVDPSSSHNLIGTGGSGGLTNGVNNNLVDVADARLRPLANNGGPTQTHALFPDSPALDAGDDCVTEVAHCGEPRIPQITTDQRGAGFIRKIDGPADANTTATVDIGAYETQVPFGSLPDIAINEDTQLVLTFDVAEAVSTTTTAASSNPALVPEDQDHLTSGVSGTTAVTTITPLPHLFGTTVISITFSGSPTVQSFTLTVNSSNDAPSFTKGADQTVVEDAGPQTVNNWATNLVKGPANEAAQTLNFEITNNTNAALFSAAPAISPTGTLTYTAAPDAHGTATITAVLKDSGGTENAGVDTSVAQTFVITVLSVNDAPSFTKGPDQTVNEDSGTRFVAWATNISPGPANESNQLPFMSSEITNNTNPALFSFQPTINSQGTLAFTPAANANGSATISIRLRDDGGTANGGINVSASETFTITVVPVNDRPAVTGAPNHFVNEDSGPQTVTNWATITPGPADEAAQTLTMTVTNNNNALFTTQPDVSLAGTLTYTPAANATGVAIVSMTIKDNGGTANGGQDTFVRNFAVVLQAVNDAPVNTVPGPQTAIKNSSLFFSASDANQISVADVDGGTAARQVTLNVSNGLLTVKRTTGLTFSSGNGSSNGNMIFSGTIADINAALNGLRFTPGNDFVGSAQLQIETNDLGNTGTGGALTDSDTVNITVADSSALQFSATAYAVVESAEAIKITVTRIGSGGAASVNYSTSDGTALGGGSCSASTDYISSSGTLSWAAGETSAKTFMVPVCDDLFFESDETVNLTLSGVSGEASLGGPRNAVLTITQSGLPVLLTEENTENAIALDLVNNTRDPFSLTSQFNLSGDQRRRVSLFVWRLALRPTETAADLVVTAEDTEARVYPLPVEFVGAMNDPLLVTQIVVRLPDNVVGAPRDLKVTVTLRGQATNKGVIKIAAP